LIEKMELVQTYKDVTFEILNRKDFLPLIQEASPTVNFKRNFVQPARKRSEPLRPRLLGRPTSARVARNMSAARAFPNTWPVTAAVATCVLFFAPTVFAQPASDSLGELLVGKAAFGDWRTDAPLVRRKITELPPPYATRSASNPPRVIARPVSAVPRVPPGFQVELFASNLRDPRTVREC